jgi:hypothetical protein
MIVLKGFSTITTSTSDIVPNKHDLFSHPYTYQHNKSDPPAAHRFSRENLFSEPAGHDSTSQPASIASDRRPTRPPRVPFEQINRTQWTDAAH